MAGWNIIDHTEIGTGGAATYEVSSISASYDHLFILMSLRTERSGYVLATCNLQVGNGSLDTGTNYSNTRCWTQGYEPASDRNTGAVGINELLTLGDSATADTFSAHYVWIPNYTSSNYKPILMRSMCQPYTTTGNEWGTDVVAGLWQSTSAITNVGVHVNTGGDMTEFSTFTMWGILGV